MRAFFKYAVILALGLAVGFNIRAPLSLEEIARLNWLDEINIIIDKAVARAKPEADVIPVDPAGAALIDDELDYRIAQRIASLDGWRAFLAVHGNGVYAQSARAEVERLLAAKAPAPAAAEVSNGASPDAKATSDGAGSAPPSPVMEVATLTPDEICKRDGDRLERLRSSPTSDEAAQFANELGCEKLRPQLSALMEGLGYASPAPAAAEVSNGASPDAKATSDRVGSAPPSSGMEVAALTPEEICRADGDRLERLRNSPTSDEAARFANELGCETLRPQLLALTESLGYASPAPVAAPPSPSTNVTAPGPKRRATVPPSEMRSTASPRGVQPKRHANGCAFKSGCFWGDSSRPPILLALLGERPKHSSASRRTLTYPRPNDFRGR